MNTRYIWLSLVVYWRLTLSNSSNDLLPKALTTKDIKSDVLKMDTVNITDPEKVDKDKVQSKKKNEEHEEKNEDPKETLLDDLFVDVALNDSVMNIKKMIQARKGIPLNQQHLFFSGTELDNDQIIGDYHIQKGATFHLKIDRSKTNTINHHQKKTPIDFSAMKTNSIKADTGIHDPIAKQLQKEKSAFKKIESSTKYSADGMKIQSHDLKIIQKDKKTKNLVFDASENTTIANIKARIQEMKGIPTNHQQLVFNGTQLEDDHTLSDYEIRNANSLHLATNTKKKNKVVSSHEKQTIKFSDKDNLIKKATQSQDIKKIDEQKKIVFSEQKKSEEKFSVHDNSVKIIAQSNNMRANHHQQKTKMASHSLQIIHNNPKKKSLIFDVLGNTTIANIKEKIKDVKGIPVNHQKLSFNGNELKNNKTLLDYDIQKATAIHLRVDPLHPHKKFQTLLKKLKKNGACARFNSMHMLIGTLGIMFYHSINIHHSA